MKKLMFFIALVVMSKGAFAQHCQFVIANNISVSTNITVSSTVKANNGSGCGSLTGSIVGGPITLTPTIPNIWNGYSDNTTDFSWGGIPLLPGFTFSSATVTIDDATCTSPTVTLSRCTSMTHTWSCGSGYSYTATLDDNVGGAILGTALTVTGGL